MSVGSDSSRLRALGRDVILTCAPALAMPPTSALGLDESDRHLLAGTVIKPVTACETHRGSTDPIGEGVPDLGVALGFTYLSNTEGT